VKGDFKAVDPRANGKEYLLYRMVLKAGPPSQKKNSK